MKNSKSNDMKNALIAVLGFLIGYAIERLLPILLLVLWVSVSVAQVSVSPGINPLALGPIGATTASLTGTVGISGTTTSGSYLLSVQSGATQSLYVNDGFGNSSVGLIADYYHFTPANSPWQRPLVCWPGSAVAFDNSYGSGQAFITEPSAGVLQIGTTLGGTDGSIGILHALSSGTTPSISAGTGAGTGGTASINTDGTDEQGVITIAAGTAPSVSSATICTVTFGTAYRDTQPAVILWPNNAAAATLSLLPFTSGTTTGFTLKAGVAVGLGSATTYSYNYLVKGKL